MPRRIDKLNEAYGHDEAIRRIKVYRAEHGTGLIETMEALIAQLGAPAGITDEQVRTAIAVLRAYAKNELDVEPALLVDLDAAIDDAAGTTMCEIEMAAPPEYVGLLA